ncbi:MAG: 2-hydroxyacid dehydrogenase [Bacteroidota bacterium]
MYVSRELPPKVMETLRAAAEISGLGVNQHDRPVSRSELLEGTRWCDVLVSQLIDRIDAEVFDANPRLKLVANYAVGFDNIDIAEASRRRIPVSNTPGVLTETTADLTWALIMSVARRVVGADRFMRAGKYEGWAPMLLLGQDVYGKTLGIVGLGRIGYAVAKRAGGFSMRVLYSDVERKPYDQEVKATFVDLDTLLRQSDFLTLHPFLDSGSRHLIDEPQLKMMKRTAYLINTSRGPVVNERALVKALREGTIAGAGLDVYEREPEMEPELAELENAVVLPHIASATTETRTVMGMIVVENTLAVLRSERAPTCVNPKVYDRD